MKKVVIFNAPPSCGKDEVAKYLKREFLFAHKEFKAKLIALAKLIYDVSDQQWDDMYTTKLKEQPNDLLDGKSPREALIHISEVVIKPNFGKQYFGEAAARSLSAGINIFSDGGFLNELTPVLSASDEVFVIRIYRPGHTFEGDSRKYLSDEDLTSLPFPVDNIADIQNDGTLEDLFFAVKQQLAKWGILEWFEVE